MSRVYYKSSSTGSITTSSTTEGINVSFLPEANAVYAVFHNAQTSCNNSTGNPAVTCTLNGPVSGVLWTIDDLSLGANSMPFILDARQATTGTASFPNLGSWANNWVHSGTGTTKTTRSGVEVLRFNSAGQFRITNIPAKANTDVTLFAIYEKTFGNATANAIVNIGTWSGDIAANNYILYAGITEELVGVNAGNWDTGDDLLFPSGAHPSSPVANNGRLVVNNSAYNNDGNLDMMAFFTSKNGNRVRRNGTSVTLESDNRVPPNGTTHTSDGIFVGGNSYNGEGFGGDIALLLVIYGDVGDSELAKLEGYYAHQLGLTSRLDASHPYKYNPPYLVTPGSVANTANGSAIINIREDFSGNTYDDALFKLNNNSTGSNVYVSANTLKIRITGNYFTGIESRGRYDLSNSECFLEIVNISSSGLTGTTVGSEPVQLNLWDTRDDNRERGIVYGIQWTGGSWNLFGLTYNNRGSTVNDIFSTTYSESTHRWLKIREDSGTIYFEHSANGNTWTTQSTISTSSSTYAANINVKNLMINVIAGNYNGTTTSIYSTIDNINWPNGYVESPASNTYFQTNITCIDSSDMNWHGGVSIYQADANVVSNAVFSLSYAVSGTSKLATVHQQNLVVLKLEPTDVYSTTLAQVSAGGSTADADDTYSVAETISLSAGPYVIIGSASVNDDDTSNDPTINARFLVWNDTDNLAYGYLDSQPKMVTTDFTPYWYVGTFNLTGTKKFDLRYGAASAGTATIKNRTLLALQQNNFAQIFSTHEEGSTFTTSTNETALATLNVTPTFSSDYLILSTWQATPNSATYSVFSNFSKNTVPYYANFMAQEGAPGDDDTDYTTEVGKFQRGYIGVDTLTSGNTQSWVITYKTEQSGVKSWGARRNITVINLGSDAGVIRQFGVKSGGSWYNGTPYVKSGDTWKEAIPYVKVGGVWTEVAQTSSLVATATANVSSDYTNIFA